MADRETTEPRLILIGHDADGVSIYEAHADFVVVLPAPADEIVLAVMIG